MVGKEEKQERELLGKISADLARKTPDSRDPIELQRAMCKDYDDQLMDCIKTHKQEFMQDFYVVVHFVGEKLYPNVVRNYFMGRKSCPTPEYNQIVYEYKISDDSLNFMWVVPDKITCQVYRDSAVSVHPQKHDLLRFVLDFYDGTLDAISKQRNSKTI